MHTSFHPNTKNFLKENFSSYLETKNLWVEAGGKASMIADTHDAKTRWEDLFRKMDSGAIEPIKLIIGALYGYPLNKTLLIELRNQLSEGDLDKARKFLALPNNNSIIDLNQIPIENASAAVSIALTESIQPKVLSDKYEDAATQEFKKSFASKAGELIAVAGSAGWTQVFQTIISNL
ncbi:hypothetical protein [Acinetobacter albensis]|uniref:Uncharacterized protein n=1 Tax=Acinetobacter albensis TaxID=1673609 RepID=A0A1C4GRZ8_9GAMM|nr:hypothetical protein [Acinetobacter albensis]SCC70916.1 hypothetical protein GA0116959_1022 [Acinetobacter albensis]